MGEANGGRRRPTSAWPSPRSAARRPDEVLRDADAALHQAKLAGRGRYAMFDRAMRDQITPSTAERRLRRALDNGELRLYYQPIVSLWTKRLVGVEALLRWNEPSRGVIDPDEFMDALEDTGLIVPIGGWIIEEVARQCRAWHDEFPDRPTLTVKINVSERQLGQANFVSQLHGALERSGADPAWIYLEIAEGVLMHDPTAISDMLAEVQALGVNLAIDHFGTGYSSLSHLRQLQLAMLTIDQLLRGRAGAAPTRTPPSSSTSSAWPRRWAWSRWPKGSRRPSRSSGCASSTATWPRAGTSAIPSRPT